MCVNDIEIMMYEISCEMLGDNWFELFEVICNISCWFDGVYLVVFLNVFGEMFVV